MTSDPTAEQLAELVALAEKATPGPWVRVTEGNASVEQLAHKLLHDLSVPLAEGIPANTDATYVLTADGSKSVALVGNGPKQTDNGDFIVAAANLAEPLARDVSQLRDRVAELTALARQCGEALAAVHTASSASDEILVDLMTPELFAVVDDAVVAYQRAALPEIPS